MNTPNTPVLFDIWGCRGSRNLALGASSVGIRTSCCSLQVGADLVFFDAGSGLIEAGRAFTHAQRWPEVERVHILLSHSHMDHWEGLKDVEWIWEPSRPFQFALYGPEQTLTTIHSAFAPPSFVPLDRLALFNGVAMTEHRLEPMRQYHLGELHLSCVPLNHVVVDGDTEHKIVSLGFRLETPAGLAFAYACDHQPTSDLLGLPSSLMNTSAIVVDAYHASISEHGFGHGSIEYAANLAASYPDVLVIATHLNPARPDSALAETMLRYNGLRNLRLAREHDTLQWSPAGWTDAVLSSGASV